jgi:hypothetical protein
MIVTKQEIEPLSYPNTLICRQLLGGGRAWNNLTGCEKFYHRGGTVGFSGDLGDLEGLFLYRMGVRFDFYFGIQ